MSIIAGNVFFSAHQGQASDDFNDIPAIIGAVNDALENEPTGVVVRWENPATGNSGSVTVQRTFFESDRTPCRDYVRRTNGDASAMTRGTGCRAGTGVWKLTESESLSAEPSRTASIKPDAGSAKPKTTEVSSTEVSAGTSLTSDVQPSPISKPQVISGSMPSRSY